MAQNPQLTNAAASAAADAVLTLLDGGYLRIYDGTQPATADAAITSQVLLAELQFGTPAFSAAAAGVASSNTITSDTSANATGTASWFRCFKADGTTTVFDGTVGTSGCDLNLTSTTITAGNTVSVSALSYTQSKT